jgi:hypothetical protein
LPIVFAASTIFFVAKKIVFDDCRSLKEDNFKVGQSFASPKLVVFGARSPLASCLFWVNSGYSPTNRHNYIVFALYKACQLLFIYLPFEPRFQNNVCLHMN